jgi:hypothetical protein
MAALFFFGRLDRPKFNKQGFLEDLMPIIPSGKYQLKSLHEEIDLFDRKLAHLHRFETFATEADRNATAEKLSAKRNLLVRKAQQMIDEGIEFSETERPKSLRSETDTPQTVETPPVPVEAPVEPAISFAPSSQPSSLGDFQKDLEDYKRNRMKRKTA